MPRPAAGKPQTKEITQLMKWMKLTRYNGEEIFVNLQQVVYVEAYEEGRR
jgi:hypothetical protein